MKFDSDITFFIDGSYTCTGVMALTSDKQITFAGFSRAETKRSLQNYWIAAQELVNEATQWLSHFCHDHKVKTVSVVIEAPFDGGYASSGLWMLQALFLRNFSLWAFELGDSFKLYSLAPSYISGQIKKVCNKKDGTGVRKSWTNERLVELEKEGYMVTNPTELKAAGCDRQTAFGFWYFLSHSDKELPEFRLEA